MNKKNFPDMYGIVGKFWVLGNTGTVAACLYFSYAYIPIH